MAHRTGRGLPRAVQLILVNAAMGAGVGAVVTTAALLRSGLGLAALITASGAPWTAAALLFSGVMTTFAGLAAGTAIMLTVRRKPPDRS